LNVLITGTGSGGHIYPALAVAEALKSVAGAEPDVLFLGTKQGLEGDILHHEWEGPSVLLDIGVWEHAFLASPVSTAKRFTQV
jgi:UDP-N-acetylglucosamine:LPS N-acetylglucosamine transferase